MTIVFNIPFKLSLIVVFSIIRDLNSYNNVICCVFNPKLFKLILYLSNEKIEIDCAFDNDNKNTRILIHGRYVIFLGDNIDMNNSGVAFDGINTSDG